jgi:3-mercaptopyruvate sulfurtransferase SseA
MRFQSIRWCSARVLLAALASVTGCTGTSTTDKDLVFVNTIQAQELVQGKKKLLGLAGTQAGTWIDARSEEDFKAGHIPGAVNLPYERVTKDHGLLKQYEILIVYGSDYNDSRADGMSKRLLELGHHDVRTLTGGLRAWKSDGNPLETE